MTDLVVAHTSQVPPEDLAAGYRLMVLAFNNFDERDWDNALGGLHVLVRDAGVLIGHAAIVQRHLVHRGRALRTGYVEAVGVHPDAQRRGIGATMMATIEDIAERAYDIGALAASHAGVPLYESRGWQRWTGETAAMTPTGVRRSSDDERIYVMPFSVEMDLTGELLCDWRDGDLW